MNTTNVIIAQLIIGWIGFLVSVFTFQDAWRNYSLTRRIIVAEGIQIMALGDLLGEGLRIVAHLLIIVPTTIAIVVGFESQPVPFTWRVVVFVGITVALASGSINSAFTRHRLMHLFRMKMQHEEQQISFKDIVTRIERVDTSINKVGDSAKNAYQEANHTKDQIIDLNKRLIEQGKIKEHVVEIAGELTDTNVRVRNIEETVTEEPAKEHPKKIKKS